MHLKPTPKRRRKFLDPRNVEAWVGAFVRRGKRSIPVPLDVVIDRYIGDTKSDFLREESKSMEQLRVTVAGALGKVWGLDVSDTGCVLDAEVLKQVWRGGKLWLSIPSATIHYGESGFNEKDLTTRGSITGGSACLFGCTYCSTPTILGRSSHTRILRLLGIKHADAFIQRLDAVETLRAQLTHKDGAPRFKDDHGVVILSPIVDPLANEGLLEQALELILVVMELTGWDVRVLTKSLLIRKLAARIPAQYRNRIIYGLSTGILDDEVADVVEQKTPRPSLRLKAYQELQQQELRTYSMHCPILPQPDYLAYAERLAEKTNWDGDELVWCEALNRRGDSMAATIAALSGAAAALLAEVSGSGVLWEARYNRPLFEALAAVCPPGKLRYLVYPAKADRDYWLGCRGRGAVVLGEESLPEGDAT